MSLIPNMQNKKRRCVIEKLRKQTAVWAGTYFPMPAHNPAATPLWIRVTLRVSPLSLADRHSGDLTGQDDTQR